MCTKGFRQNAFKLNTVGKERILINPSAFGLQSKSF